MSSARVEVPQSATSSHLNKCGASDCKKFFTTTSKFKGDQSKLRCPKCRKDASPKLAAKPCELVNCLVCKKQFKVSESFRGDTSKLKCGECRQATQLATSVACAAAPESPKNLFTYKCVGCKENFDTKWEFKGKNPRCYVCRL
jgi:hypothetical protein